VTRDAAPAFQEAAKHHALVAGRKA